MGSLKKVEGGITFPQGFRAAGVEAHVKYPNRKDFALLVSDVPAACAGADESKAFFLLRQATVLPPRTQSSVIHHVYFLADITHDLVHTVKTGISGYRALMHAVLG